MSADQDPTVMRLQARIDELEAELATVQHPESRSAPTIDLLPCYCHGDDLVPYCPRHTPLPGENPAPSAADLASTVEGVIGDAYPTSTEEKEALAALALLAQEAEKWRHMHDAAAADWQEELRKREAAEAERDEAREVLAGSHARGYREGVREADARWEARVAALEQALTRWRASLAFASPNWGWIVREIDALQSGGSEGGDRG